MDYGNILLTFFIANSIFWGLFSHKAHCTIVSYFNELLKLNIKCPTHGIHILMGVFFYVGSIYLAQKDVPEFKKLMASFK
tara:strand:+ start:764 stop:1003 length:240 start_codon:yes stop_codon:yes gene_type:complete